VTVDQLPPTAKYALVAGAASGGGGAKLLLSKNFALQKRVKRQLNGFLPAWKLTSTRIDGVPPARLHDAY